MKHAVVHLLSDARGVYIPQNFVEMFDIEQWGLDPESWAVKKCLEGPDVDGYWDAWDELLRKAERKNGEYTYTLYQDGDLWALCYERMDEEEKSNFGFDEE
jgi:hypothetical protein